MIKIRQAVIVEGKYDKIKLSSIVDAPIICTEGFGIFRDKERQELIRKLAEKRGILVLTDSDSAGFIIRNFIGSTVDRKYITNAYIPDIFGKERRKDSPSKEGKIGVEGVPEAVIVEALERAGVFCESVDEPLRPITKQDLYNLGFSGKKDSAEKRKKLLKYYGLPSRLTCNSLVPVLNSITDYDCFLDDIKIMEGTQVCCE